MPSDRVLTETRKLELPKELLTALQDPAQRPRTDYGIESLKPSFFGRLIERLLGPKD